MAPTPNLSRSPSSRGCHLPTSFVMTGLADFDRHHHHYRNGGVGLRRRRRRRVTVVEPDDSDAGQTTDEASQDTESPNCQRSDRSSLQWTYSLEVHVSDHNGTYLVPSRHLPPSPPKQPLALLRSSSSSTSPARRHAKQRTVPQASNNYCRRLGIKSSLTDNEAASTSASTSMSASLSSSASVSDFPFRFSQQLQPMTCRCHCRCCPKAAATEINSHSQSIKPATLPRPPTMPSLPSSSPPHLSLPTTTSSSTSAEGNSVEWRRRRQDSRPNSHWHSSSHSKYHSNPPPPPQYPNPQQYPHQYHHLQPHPHAHLHSIPYPHTPLYQQPDSVFQLCPSSPNSFFSVRQQATHPYQRHLQTQALTAPPQLPYMADNGVFYPPRWQPSSGGYWQDGANAWTPGISLASSFQHPSSLISF